MNKLWNNCIDLFHLLIFLSIRNQYVKLENVLILVKRANSQAPLRDHVAYNELKLYALIFGNTETIDIVNRWFYNSNYIFAEPVAWKLIRPYIVTSYYFLKRHNSSFCAKFIKWDFFPCLFVFLLHRRMHKLSENNTIL